jgi:hypothetical protein
MDEVTRILSAIDQGDPHAAEQLLPLVYAELRRLAAPIDREPRSRGFARFGLGGAALTGVPLRAAVDAPVGLHPV